jgi:hypothetical protein
MRRALLVAFLVAGCRSGYGGPASDGGPPPDAAPCVGTSPCEAFLSDGRCFLYCNPASSERLGWGAANEHCRELGGYLATIRSREDDQVFSGFLAGEAWVGLVRDPAAASPEEGWSWVGGQPFEYAAWLPGSPNDELAPCGAKTQSGGWDDRPCSQSYRWFCELER